MQILSKRLTVIAEKIPLGDNICDVGCDHAYLSAYLAESGKYGKITATDINEKPLENARKTLAARGIEDINLILCNGLEKVTRDMADTVIIAGMGGEVISGIMDRCAFLKNNVTLILQPMTGADFLRRYLSENGYEICDETCLSENNKIYSVIKAKYSGKVLPCTPVFAVVGKIDAKDILGRKYIEKQYKICEKALNKLKNAKNKTAEYEHFANLSSNLKNILEE